MRSKRITVGIPAETVEVRYRTRQLDTHVNFEISLDGKHWFIAAEISANGKLFTWGDKTYVTSLDFNDYVEEDD